MAWHLIFLANAANIFLFLRAATATTLSGLCFLGGGEMAEVVSTMATLESVFSTAYTK